MKCYESVFFLNGNLEFNSIGQFNPSNRTLCCRKTILTLFRKKNIIFSSYNKWFIKGKLSSDYLAVLHKLWGFTLISLSIHRDKNVKCGNPRLYVVNLFCCVIRLRVSRGCFDGAVEGVIDNAYLSTWGVDANEALNSTYSLAQILNLIFKPTREVRFTETLGKNCLGWTLSGPISRESLLVPAPMTLPTWLLTAVVTLSEGSSSIEATSRVPC